MTVSEPDINKTDRMRPGPRRRRIDEIIRVDQAGEYGAVAIYRGQKAVFGALPHKSRTAALIEEMEAGEAHHLSKFDQLVMERGVRPTLLGPAWNSAGFLLGAATALMGEKSAMACTAAVEDVIEKHYASQAEELAAVDPELCETVREFREDELEHKTTAETEGAADAPANRLLSAVIGAGCRVAIKLAEKI